MRPDLRHIENIPFIALSVLGVHHLKADIPLRIFAPLDGLVEILHEMIWILPGDPDRRLAVVVLNAELGLNVDLDVFEGTVLLGELVGVAAEGIHFSEGGGGTAIAEVVHELVDAFLVANVEAMKVVSLKLVPKVKVRDVLPELCLTVSIRNFTEYFVQI